MPIPSDRPDLAFPSVIDARAHDVSFDARRDLPPVRDGNGAPPRRGRAGALPRTLVGSFATVVVALGSGCSSGTAPTAPPASGSTVGSTVGPVSVPTGSAPPASSTTSAPGPGSTVRPTATGAARTEFRAVLLDLAAPSGTDDSAGTDALPVVGVDPSSTLVLPAPGGATERRVQLGPVLLDGSAIEKAEAQIGQDDRWAVRLVFTPTGIERFNAIAATCVAQRASLDPAVPPTALPPGSVLCPTGRIAVVVDGAVVTDPTVNTANFEPDQVQISGDFDEAEARALAAAITDHP